MAKERSVTRIAQRRVRAEHEALIEIIRQRVEETSLRVVAARVGLSHSGLHRILLGNSDPTPRTLAKLIKFASGAHDNTDQDADRDIAALVLTRLLAYVPEGARPSVLKDIARDIGSLRGGFATTPPWVSAIYAELHRIAPEHRSEPKP